MLVATRRYAAASSFASLQYFPLFPLLLLCLLHVLQEHSWLVCFSVSTLGLPNLSGQLDLWVLGQQSQGGLLLLVVL